MKKILLCVIALAALLTLTAATASADAPTPTPVVTTETLVLGHSLSGMVWQDYCETDCTAGSGLRRGNGLPDEAEKRLAGVTVGLGYGYCRYSHVVRTTTTNALGEYKFSGLANGTYCVTVNSRQSNTAFPKPGVWTRPSGRSPWYIASYTVRIWGASRGYLYFAWDKNP
jgi:hypothetical protein